MAIFAYVCGCICALFAMVNLALIWDTLTEIRDELRKLNKGKE